MSSWNDDENIWRKKWFRKIRFYQVSESEIYGYYSIILISYIIVYECMQIHWNKKNRKQTSFYLYFIHFIQEFRYMHILIHISNQKGKGNRNVSKNKISELIVSIDHSTFQRIVSFFFLSISISFLPSLYFYFFFFSLLLYDVSFQQRSNR